MVSGGEPKQVFWELFWQSPVKGTSALGQVCQKNRPSIWLHSGLYQKEKECVHVS